MNRLLLLLTLLGLWATASGQQPSAVHGDYAGVLASLQVKVHITAAVDGTLSGTLSLGQGAMGIPCADFSIQGQKLTFSVPAVRAIWKGSFSDDGATLTGTWDQGTPVALNMTRDVFVPAATPSRIDGYWLGIIQLRGQSPRLQMTLKRNAAGQEFCTLDSLDRNSYGTPCANVVFAGTQLSFDVPSQKESWKGTLSADGQQLSGSVTGRQTAVLNFARETTLQVAPALLDPALPPVDATGMQAVLTRDLEQALKTGALAPETMAGVSIGVLRDGVSRVFAFGTAKPDSLYEIGSITKTFTGLVLAQMIAQGKVALNDPVRKLLPQDALAAPNGTEITLLDLVTQHSGLPRMPDNLHPADRYNPYADYRPADLYSFLRQHGLQKPADAGYLYSNLGVGLLGQALADRAGTSYGDLVRREVLLPLRMRDTHLTLSPAQQTRVIQGYDANHKPAHSWESDALAGAGAIRSTAADMLVYLDANLHPDHLPSGAEKYREGRTLSAALDQSHVLRDDVDRNTRIAFAWMFVEQAQIFWHNGATAGYSSFAFFNPKDDFAAVVLFNTAPGRGTPFADMLGAHILQRFTGMPAISLSSGH